MMKFLHMLTMTVAQSSVKMVEYIMYLRHGAKGAESKMSLCLVLFARWQYWVQSLLSRLPCLYSC